MTVELFAKWLLDNFPHNAILVKTNSFSWFSNEVERVKAEELPRHFHLKEKPEMNHKPVAKPCLVIYDEKHCDY
jgi:hypothetical protein